jgi:hypothetical protein
MKRVPCSVERKQSTQTVAEPGSESIRKRGALRKADDPANLLAVSASVHCTAGSTGSDLQRTDGDEHHAHNGERWTRMRPKTEAEEAQ